MNIFISIRVPYSRPHIIIMRKYIYIYIFRFKSYLLTRVARIENTRWESMCRVVNEFTRSVLDVKSKGFSYRESQLLNSRDGRRRGKVRMVIEAAGRWVTPVVFGKKKNAFRAGVKIGRAHV